MVSTIKRNVLTVLIAIVAVVSLAPLALMLAMYWAMLIVAIFPLGLT